MAISLIRELAQKQKVTLTPLLKKSIDLLQLSRYEIIQKINEEIDINPFLEKIELDSSEGELNDDFFSSEYEKDVVAHQSLKSQSNTRHYLLCHVENQQLLLQLLWGEQQMHFQFLRFLNYDQIQ